MHRAGLPAISCCKCTSGQAGRPRTQRGIAGSTSARTSARLRNHPDRSAPHRRPLSGSHTRFHRRASRSYMSGMRGSWRRHKHRRTAPCSRAADNHRRIRAPGGRPNKPALAGCNRHSDSSRRNIRRSTPGIRTRRRRLPPVLPPARTRSDIDIANKLRRRSVQRSSCLRNPARSFARVRPLRRQDPNPRFRLHRCCPTHPLLIRRRRRKLPTGHRRRPFPHCSLRRPHLRLRSALYSHRRPNPRCHLIPRSDPWLESRCHHSLRQRCCPQAQPGSGSRATSGRV